ncbi:two-component regulator propeller domain-containing protein, partial [Bacteroidota bacterium]
MILRNIKKNTLVRCWFLLCIVFLFTIISTEIIYTQQKDIKFELFNIENGLPDNKTNVLFQDSFGFLWLGTDNGLARYDGYEFIIFKPDPSDTNAISDRFITAIAEDYRNNIWIGTRNGGVNEYLRDEESFTQHNDKIFENESGISKHITYILSSTIDTSVMWIGTHGHGLIRINLLNKEYIKYRNNPFNTNSLASDFITSVVECEDDPTILWVGTIPNQELGQIGGLVRFDITDNVFKSFIHDNDDSLSINNNYIKNIYKDNAGNLWIATDNGICSFNRRFFIAFRYKSDTENKNSLSSNSVFSIFEDNARLLWIGTSDGLNIYDKSKNLFVHYKYTPSSDNTISDNIINDIYEDRSGILWVATNNGLNKLNRSIRNFPHYKNNPVKSNSLSNNIVYSFFKDNSENLWVGTRQGLNKININKERYKHFYSDPQSINTLSSNIIFTLYQSPGNTDELWVGTANGLNLFNLKTNSFTHFLPDPKNSNSLSHKSVIPIYEDSNGLLWIGTYGGGLNKYDKNTGIFTHYKSIAYDNTSISSNRVTAICEDDKGYLWIGTYGGGLNKFNPFGNTFERISLDPMDPNSIEYDIIDIYKDSKNRIWIGTNNLGLYQLNTENSKLIDFFTERDGLPYNGVRGIIEDHDGSLWISTERGLSKLNPETKEYINYDVDDGLQSNKFLNKSAYRDDKGRLYFGGDNGFNAFFPQRVKNPYPPETVITEFRLFNKPIMPGPDSPLTKNIIKTNIINLSYDENDISFGFVGIHFNRPSRNRYSYKLEPYEEDWREVEVQRTATYTNLSPGSYSFKVRSANSDGVWDNNYELITIIIGSPIWLRWYALALYLIVIGGFLFGVRQLINERTNQKIQVKEAKLKLKTIEAEARAVKAENERKTHELEEARKLQLSMLPNKIPELTNLEIAVYMKPATEVGGDYYDIHVNQEGILTAVIGDATGHGLKAGTMVSVMKGLFCSDAHQIDIKSFLEKCSIAIKHMNLWNLYMALTILKIKEYEMEISSAGMPPIYLYRKDNNTLEKILLKAMPLGAFEDFEYTVKRINLSPGDTVILMTDGLPELFNNNKEMLNYSQIEDLLKKNNDKSPNKIIDDLVQLGDNWR